MDHQLNLLYYRTTAVALQGKNKKNGVVSHKLIDMKYLQYFNPKNALKNNKLFHINYL